MAQKKKNKRSNNNIFSSYISSSIPKKIQQLVSKLLVLRACVRPRGKNNRGKPVRNLLRKIKKLHSWPETSCQHLRFSPEKTVKMKSVKMKSYLEASGLWNVVMFEIQPLQEDPTVAKIRNYNDEVIRRAKTKTCIHSTISDVVFTRIMFCETVKEAWNTLQEAFQGNERTRHMQVLNLRREFEMLRMKEAETIKEYFDRLLAVVNKIQLLREDLLDRRIVKKELVSLLERFEAKISSLEDSRDLTMISLTELMNSMQIQEQRRLLRKELLRAEYC